MNFKTQEIGSIDKLSFRTKASKGKPLNERDIAEARNWGAKLNVLVDEKLLAKKEKTKEDIAAIRDLSSLMAIRFFEKAGLDIVYDGEQKRVEMYQHAIQNTNGFNFVGHVRSFDDKYYNIASCENHVSMKNLFHTDELKFIAKSTKMGIKVPITGAATLAYWSDNKYYIEKWAKENIPPKKRNLAARREFILDLARNVLRPNIKSLVESGATKIQIDEPAASMFISKEDLEIFAESFNESVKGINCEFSMHICFSDYGALFPQILEMKKCSEHAWEFANRDSTKLGVSKETRDGYYALNYFKEYGFGGNVGLGVINVHSNFIPSPELIRDRTLYGASVLGPEHILVNPDCGLRTRSWEIAFEMLSCMTKGAELAREAV